MFGAVPQRFSETTSPPPRGRVQAPPSRQDPNA
jgi:hypothetical protein